MPFAAHKLWWMQPDLTGLVWNDLGQLSSETRIHSLVYLGNGIVLAGSSLNGKIFRSTDYGENWTDLGQQASETYIRSTSSCKCGVALAGTYPNAKIFRSIDYGATWTDLGQQDSETYVLSLAYLENGIAPLLRLAPPIATGLELFQAVG